MAQYLPPGRQVDIISGEWGYSTCKHANGSVMDCIEGANTGPNSYQDQAKFLARQWYVDLRELPCLLHKAQCWSTLCRLVNALEDIPISIFYDWHNDGINASEGEFNFGTVEHTYNNASLPYVTKPSYIAAGVLQSMFRGRSLVKRHTMATAFNTSDDNAYALEFEGGRLALWKIDGTTECQQEPRIKTDCGASPVALLYELILVFSKDSRSMVRGGECV